MDLGITGLGSWASRRVFRGLLVDCGAAKIPAYQRLSPKFGAKARLTIGRVVPGRQGARKVRGPSLRWDPSTARAVPGLRPNRISSVNGLAVQREIETLALHLIADTQSDEDVDDLEDDQRHDGVVDEDDDDALDLVDYLHRVAFDQAGGAAVLLDREHAGEQRADGAA